MYNTHSHILGQNLRAARERAGITQKRLAVAIYLDKGDISRAENGKRHIRAVDLWRAAQFLDVPVESFYASMPAVKRQSRQAA